jgi:hypothetical protein
MSLAMSVSQSAILFFARNEFLRHDTAKTLHEALPCLIFWLMTGFFGYCSVRDIARRIKFKHGCETTEQYRIRVQKGTAIIIGPIEGKGESILRMTVDDVDAGESTDSLQLEFKASWEGPDRTQRHIRRLTISPGYVDREYEIELGDTAVWPVAFTIVCISVEWLSGAQEHSIYVSLIVAAISKGRAATLPKEPTVKRLFV